MVDHPSYPLLFYNLACCESLTGQTTDALDHVPRAIAMSDECRTHAMDDPDFAPIRDEPVFGELTGG